MTATVTDNESFEALLAQFDDAHPGAAGAEPAIGERVTGTLVSIGEDAAFLDLGGKCEGRLDLAALRDEQGEYRYQPGDRIETLVTGKDEDSGMLLLGNQAGHRYHGLEEVERATRQGLPVQGIVTAAVKGGLEVQVAGLRAFCPASQVDLRFIEDLSEFVGQRLDFAVTKLEGGRRPNLVLSRRQILETQQRLQAEALRARLVVGAVLKGTVTRLMDYGAFVDLGGLEGMIHVSELAFNRIRHPSEILTVGQEVEVAVLRLDPPQAGRDREKIALSLRALAADPWQDAAERFPIGTRVRGTVSRIQPFGVFVELAPGLDGLIHISELNAGRRLNHPSEVVQVGEPIEAEVLGLDRERRRIGLARVAAAPDADTSDTGAERPTAAAPPKPSSEPAMGTFGALLKEQLQRAR